MKESNTPSLRSRQAAFSLPLTILTVLFCVLLIISNLIEIKTVDLGWLQITAGFVVFPLSYIINDCIVEVYGFSKARLVIWLGFAMSLMVSLFLQLAIVLPGSAEWTGQEAMASIYGNVPRIMGASFTAFLCGSMINAYVMAKMKLASGGRHFSARAIVSTLWGESVDSLIFFPVAFGGLLPWDVILRLMVTQALLKTGYEVIILPVTIRTVRLLKRLEGGAEIPEPQVKSYKWWRINEL